MQKIFKQDEETKALRNLFKNCVFFISREIPKEIFSVVILSSGGLFGDDSENSSFKQVNLKLIQNDKRITHYIVDRKPEFVELIANKEFVQPQWIFDCVNQSKLLPVSEYAPGKNLPPHISPFFDYDNNEYKPKINKKAIDNNEAKKDVEIQEIEAEETEGELNEMLISNKKKKLLEKIRKETARKYKQPRIKKSV